MITRSENVQIRLESQRLNEGAFTETLHHKYIVSDNGKDVLTIHFGSGLPSVFEIDDDWLAEQIENQNNAQPIKPLTPTDIIISGKYQVSFSERMMNDTDLQG
jgi:hypothetical protein